MPADNSTIVRTQGNVIFCDFGTAAARPGEDQAALDDALAGIRAAITQINNAAAETLAANIESSILEKEVAQLLLQALDGMDNVAFQSRILLAGAVDCGDGEAEFIVESLWRFVSAGAVVSERLRALCGERRSWLTAEARVLRGILTQAERLEATACDCIKIMSGEVGDGHTPG